MKNPFILLVAAAALTLFAAACTPSRFASCQADADCGSRGDAGKLVCYNLRCVECHYDADCTDGKICGTANTCESLDTRTPEAEAPPPAKTLEECAKRCKGNAACGESCREQFKGK